MGKVKVDPKVLMIEIKAMQVTQKTLKQAIVDAEGDQEARGVATTTYEAHMKSLREKATTLKALRDEAITEAELTGVFDDIEMLTSPEGAALKKGILAGASMAAQVIDYEQKEVAHIDAYREYLSGKAYSAIDGEKLKLIEPKSDKSVQSIGGAILPKSIAIRMMGEHRAKQIGHTSADIMLARKANTLVSDIPEYGGDTVPPSDFQRTILNLAEEPTHIMDHATVLPSATGKIEIPKAVQTDDNEFGGMNFKWVAEAGNKEQTDTEFTMETIETFEASMSIDVSERLLSRNAINLESFLIQKGRKTLEHGLDVAFINGDGNGKPVGFLNTAGIREVPREEVGKVGYTDINNLKYSLMPQHRASAIYVMEDGVLQGLDGLLDKEGRPLFKNTIANGPYDRLNGSPYISMTYMPEKGYMGDISFIDLSDYYVAMEKDIVVRRLDELKALNNVVVFAMYVIVGGQLVQERMCSVLSGPDMS